MDARLDHATGLVLACNSERTVDRTLSSLDFCGELLVVDSGSTDATIAIAGRHGARVLHRDWTGIQAQFRFAMEHVRTPWVVQLDSDEWFCPELKALVAERLRAPGDAAGFWCRRKTWYLDRWITHSGWYPDRVLRVFRADAARLTGQDPHHGWAVDGSAPRLERGDILHDPYRDLRDHVERMNRYAQTMAQGLHQRGERASLGKALGHGCARFCKQYLLKRGFLDGRAGLALAVNSGFYAFHKYLRLLEMEARQGEDSSD